MEVQCAFCRHTVVWDVAIPGVGDEAAWEELAWSHGEGCAWILTRAHQRDRPNDISKAAAALGRKGGAAGRGASKRRDVDYSALGKRGGRPRRYLLVDDLGRTIGDTVTRPGRDGERVEYGYRDNRENVLRVEGIATLRKAKSSKDQPLPGYYDVA